MNPIALGESLRTHIATTVATFDHPAESLPTDEGRVLPAAVVAMHAPRDGYRMEGRRSNGVQSATVHCVGSTRDEALWVAVRVREALDGFRITSRAGTAREDSFAVSEPYVIPNSNPHRFEIPLVFNFPL